MISLTGQTLGKYQLNEPLGAGGMAQVYRAVQLPLERSVAVKVLHPHLAEQEIFRERFLREAKAVASLRHPHIVQIYDYDFMNGTCYMAMEFLDGASLEDRLKKLADQAGAPTPLPLPEALRITIQVAEALAFAHRQGVIHRDIKPANIMQTAEGRTILTDFGIATILHETRLTVDGGTSGTPSYISPEQAQDERGDERSDIYSLGAVLYQLVTGRLPFEADTLYGLIMKHIYEPPPSARQMNPELPAALEQIILRAMEKEPARRYQTANDMAADLQAVLDGETITIGRAVPQPARAILTGHRGWLVGLIILIVAIGLGLAVSLRQGTPAPEAVESAALPNSVEGVVSMAAVIPPRELAEDFEDNRLGWLTTTGPVSRQVSGGVYQIAITAPNRAIAAYPELGGTYDDLVIQAEASLRAGQPESGYGLIFRRQDDDNYYVFAVNGLGQWSIWRLQDRQWRELRGLPDGKEWTPATAILPAGKVNRLKVIADGANLALFVNDQLLTPQPIVDEGLRRGGIGFYAATSRTSAQATAELQFDNLLVSRLEALDERP